MAPQQGGSSMRPIRFLILAVGLALLSPGGARAATPVKYTAQSLIRLGDPVGDPAITLLESFDVGTLNDQGQLVFVGYDGTGELLIQADNGKFNLLARPGDPAPFGKWPTGVRMDDAPLHMNGKG